MQDIAFNFRFAYYLNNLNSNIQFVKPLDRSWFTFRGKNMKKVVLLGVIALVMMLAVPVAMAADIAVSGNVEQPAIDVSIVGGASPSFGNLITGAACNAVTPAEGMPSVRAVVTGAGVTSWAVTASTPDIGHSVPMGRMYTAGASQYLTNDFLLGSDTYPYSDLNPAISNFMTGTTAETRTDGLYMKQCISPADLNGAYSITVSFTGMVTGTA